jgi:hypothetical protein
LSIEVSNADAVSIFSLHESECLFRLREEPSLVSWSG